MTHDMAPLGLLKGLSAPPGEGMVIEVHLDIMDADTVFLHRLNGLGFENDPFLDFYPAEYRLHYTGRTRAHQSDVKALLPSIKDLVAQIIREAQNADIKLYAEIELVRNVHHFDKIPTSHSFAALNNFQFEQKKDSGCVKADIHLEFRAGTVSPDIRGLLIDHCFYWVKTPETKMFPSEEIATLQTSTFHAAQLVYESLIDNPIAGSTGIHLEQKLAMIPSHPDLPMPPIIDVAAITIQDASLPSP